MLQQYEKMSPLMNIITAGGTILGILSLQITPNEALARTVTTIITQTANLPMMIKNFGLCLATAEMFPPFDLTTREGRRLDRIRRDIDRLKHCSIWNIIVCGPVNHLKVCHNLMMLLLENPFLVKDVTKSPFRCFFKMMCLFKVNLPFTRCDNYLGRFALTPPIVPMFSGQLPPWPGMPEIPNQPQTPYGPPNTFVPGSPQFPEIPSLGPNDRNPFGMNAPPFGPNNNPYSPMQFDPQRPEIFNSPPLQPYRQPNNPVEPPRFHDEELTGNRTIYSSEPTNTELSPFGSLSPFKLPSDLYTPLTQEPAKPPSILQQQPPYQPPIPTNKKQETTYSKPETNSLGSLEFSLDKSLYIGSDNPKSNNLDDPTPYQPPIPGNDASRPSQQEKSSSFSPVKQPPIPGNNFPVPSEWEKSPSIPKEPSLHQPQIPDQNRQKNQQPPPDEDGKSEKDSFGGIELSFDKNLYLGISDDVNDRYDGLTSVKR